MEFISNISETLMFLPVFIAFKVVPFLAVLTVLVFIHELGHFLVARWCGVSVEAFSVGFGREIFGWWDKHGTRWKVAWIPLGGYVKFKGDSNVASMPSEGAIADRAPDGFHSKPLWQRSAVVVAGPLANFLLAIFIFAVAFMTIGLQDPVDLTKIPAVAGSVQANSAAADAGLKAGDIITSINGNRIASFKAMQKLVAGKGGQLLVVKVRRGNETLSMNITPRISTVPDGKGGTIKRALLGISLGSAGEKYITYRRMGPVEAVRMATERTWQIITGSLAFIKAVIVGKADHKMLAGPAGIAQMTAQAAELGFLYLVQFAAVLSVSIGLINLFPIPMLDGGHLLFYAIEAIRGKPLGESAQELGFKVGLALVLSLMVFVSWNDFGRIFGG